MLCANQVRWWVSWFLWEACSGSLFSVVCVEHVVRECRVVRRASESAGWGDLPWPYCWWVLAHHLLWGMGYLSFLSASAWWMTRTSCYILHVIPGSPAMWQCLPHIPSMMTWYPFVLEPLFACTCLCGRGLTATSSPVLTVVYVSLCYESLKWLINPWFAIFAFANLCGMYLSMPVVMALFESGPKIIHTACHSHVLDAVMDRNHVVVEAAPVRFVEKGYVSPNLGN